MVKPRPARCYRTPGRPYTRTSKYKKQNFVKGIPGSKIVKFVVGDNKISYDSKIVLLSDRRILIRHNALESARLAANRFLETKVGKAGYFLRVNVFPHWIMRENPIACGAGADRYSQGMQQAFGKAIGRAACVNPKQVLMTVLVNKPNILKAKLALKRALAKLPVQGTIEITSSV